jgi:hypothetical protein
MPFKSKSQNRACWSKYNRDIKQGKTPTWNCHEFAQETDYSTLPEKVSSNLPSGEIKKDLLTLSEKDLEIMFKYYKVDNIDDLIEKIYL